MMPAANQTPRNSIEPYAIPFDGLDVSGALSARNRLIFSKIAKKSTLDDLLERRRRLQTEEEQRIMSRTTISNLPEVKSIANIEQKKPSRKSTEVERQLLCLSQSKFIWQMSRNIINALVELDQFNTKYGEKSKCNLCETGEKTDCNRELCSQKKRIKEKRWSASQEARSKGRIPQVIIQNVLERILSAQKVSTAAGHSDQLRKIDLAKLKRSFLEKACVCNIHTDVHIYTRNYYESEEKMTPTNTPHSFTECIESGCER